jgi:cell division protease FtsH
VRDIIEQAFARATQILQSRRTDLDKGSEMLLTRETVTADEFPAMRPVMVRADEPKIVPPSRVA